MWNTKIKPIRVRTQTGVERFYEVEPTSSFEGIMNDFASQIGFDINTFRFLFAGVRISREHMSWHGSLLCTKDNLEDGEPIPDTSDFDLHYFDHIVMCDTAQDSGAVLSIFESLMWRIKQQHPNIREIFVQSDNAASYQCNSLLYSFEKVTAEYGIKWITRIHQIRCIPWFRNSHVIGWIQRNLRILVHRSILG